MVGKTGRHFFTAEGGCATFLTFYGPVLRNNESGLSFSA